MLISLFICCTLVYFLTGTVEAGPKTVHIVPHSHDDLGWLETLQEYFDVNAGVDNILTTVTESLIKDPKRKFT